MCVCSIARERARTHLIALICSIRRYNRTKNLIELKTLISSVCLFVFVFILNSSMSPLSLRSPGGFSSFLFFSFLFCKQITASGPSTFFFSLNNSFFFTLFARLCSSLFYNYFRFDFCVQIVVVKTFCSSIVLPTIAITLFIFQSLSTQLIGRNLTMFLLGVLFFFSISELSFGQTHAHIVFSVHSTAHSTHTEIEK